MNQVRALPSRLEHREQEFRTRGYVLIERVVGASVLEGIYAQLISEFEQTKAEGKLFVGGGTLSGHLNCFPGVGSSWVYEALESSGIVDLVHRLSPNSLGLPSVGCNLNLPHSSAQNEHIDGYAASPFLVVNVAVVDTQLQNGAMEVMPSTHLREYKYWQLLASRPERTRLCMLRGDVLIRTSALWHRGMPNRTGRPRPMLAFTWENGGSLLADPFTAYDGKVRFLPNRFRTNWLGRLRERAFVAAPRLGRAVRAASSLFDD